MVASSPYGYAAAAPEPTAVVGRRIGAFFIDAAVATLVGFLIFFAVADHVSVDEAVRKYDCQTVLLDRLNGRERFRIDCPNKYVVTTNDTVWVADRRPVLGIGTLLSLAYFALLPGLTGWTLGKLLVGIRVVDTQGAIAGVGRNVIRWLLFAIDGFFTFFLCGLITFLASKGHRRLGDMAAGTYVVSRDAVGRSPVPAASVYGGYTPPPPGYGAPTAPPGYGAPAGYGAPTAPPGYGAPASPPGFGTPAPPAPGAPAPGPTAAGPAAPGGAPPPTWDQARNTYLQWDPAAGRYLQWDPVMQSWKPLDT